MNIIQTVMTRVFTIVVTIFLLVSLATAEVTKEKYDQIKDGMTLPEVVTILGQPTQKAEFDMLNKKHIIATWRDNGNVIVVQFINGKADLRHMTKTTMKPE